MSGFAVEAICYNMGLTVHQDKMFRSVFTTIKTDQISLSHSNKPDQCNLQLILDKELTTKGKAAQLLTYSLYGIHECFILSLCAVFVN